MDLFADFNALTNFEQNAGFTLKPLQVEDTEYFSHLPATAYFAEVGCGKTVVSTAVAMMKDSDYTIVTAPPILLTSWGNWIKKFTKDYVIYRGTPTERKALPVETAQWVIVSHALFRQDWDRFWQAAATKDRPHLIVDEAHAIKNPKSKLFEKVALTTKKASVQLLTGTPVSKPLDAYSYIKLKSPKLYRSYGHFESTHVASRDFWGSPTGYRDLELLANALALHTKTRSKKEVHGYENTPLFPDTTYELSKEHLALYKTIVEEQLLSFDDGSKIDFATSQKLFHGLQQVVVNYGHFCNDESKRSAAYDLIDQTLEETECADESKTKLIIWTVYKRTSASVLAYLAKLGIKAVGAYSDVNSNKSFEAFMEDKSVRVLVANAQSAGAGLNPQSVCSEALFLEFNMTPLLTRQAIGRLDRVGQLAVPRMKLAVAKGTIQEYLFRGLMSNDELVTRIEPTKKSLRSILLGG